MPSKKKEMGENLKKLFGIGYRRSPEGIREYVFPPGLLRNFAFSMAPKAQAFSLSLLPNMAPINVFKTETNEPETVTHERIHSGQKILANQPTIEQLNNIFGPNASGSDRGNPIMEIPADGFQAAEQDIFNEFWRKPEDNPVANYIRRKDWESVVNQQLRYNKYMNLLETLNPQGVAVAEAPMPEILQRNRMMNWPNKSSGSYIPPLPVPKIIK